MTNILIVDDSVLMRLLISDILKEDETIKVVGFASDGNEAYLKTQELKPDVILLDMNMGEFDGIYAIKNIMKECPTPIIILSSIGNQDMNIILEALELGAVDFLNKPAKNNTNLRNDSETLIQKIKDAKQANLISFQNVIKKININSHTFDNNLNYEVIVIGASTGGPTAIETIITNLPNNLAVPVLIAQHMPENFVPSFANRLNNLTPLNVVVGKKDEKIVKGNIYIAPGNRNMIVKIQNEEIYIDFTYKKFSEYNFPSVNALMLSVAEVYGKKSIGVILTGMGKDGAEGMKEIKNMNGYTIAQSQSTCVVFGMPKAAIEDNSIDSIIHLDEIAPFLVSCLS